MHIYAFGSLCRGEVSVSSDIDLLALVDGFDARFNPEQFSIYSYSKIRILWSRGSAFAWHLATESQMIYASDGQDVLKSLGMPARYSETSADCKKFHRVFLDARASIQESPGCRVFDLSSIFLGVRNIATCFSLGVLERPNFSRHSALALEGDFKLPISSQCYSVLERARILCTRSLGPVITQRDFEAASAEFDSIEGWMAKLIGETVKRD